MLDFHRLHDQFRDFSAYHVEDGQRRASRLERACDALKGCAENWEQVRDEVERAKPRALTARLLDESPEHCGPACDRPLAVTVVATDGSQIYPDRHVEPACYLLNVSRIAFHYGTLEPPVMVAEPQLRYREADLQLLRSDDGLAPEHQMLDLNAEVVSAFRDEMELELLFETAEAERQSARPILAMADGTLIRWMIRGMKQRKLEDKLVARYVEVLERFRQARIPVCSYVSMPGNAEFVNLLRFHLGEDEFTDEDETLRGLLDRDLCAECLAVGERSAVFGSDSHVLKDYGADLRICYFYVRTEHEVGRVEVPRWVASAPELLDLVHAVVLDQASKGGGYPIILQEAHERAVVRAPEKSLFYQILERELQRQGLTGYATSGKALSKRAPRV
jgi:hypothetical protein